MKKSALTIFFHDPILQKSSGSIRFAGTVRLYRRLKYSGSMPVYYTFQIHRLSIILSDSPSREAKIEFQNQQAA